MEERSLLKLKKSPLIIITKTMPPDSDSLGHDESHKVMETHLGQLKFKFVVLLLTEKNHLALVTGYYMHLISKRMKIN